MNAPLRRSGMARVLRGSHSFTCTPRVHPLSELTIPAFAFPAEAGKASELRLGIAIPDFFSNFGIKKCQSRDPGIESRD